MTPVAAPPRVRDLLRSTPDGPVRVVHVGLAALYVEVSGRAVGVLAAGATRVPCGLRTRLSSIKDLVPLLSTSAPPSAYLVGGTLHVGSRPLPVGRIEATYVPPLRHGVVRSTEASPGTVEATPPATVTGLAAALTAELVPHGRLDATGVDRLIGRGEGLTPLGDDVVAGWLAMHRAAGVPTPEVDAACRRALDRTTLLSATLLDCALHGEVIPEYAAWVAALGTPAAPRRAARLRAVGATSGAGLLHGATLALDHLQEAA